MPVGTNAIWRAVAAAGTHTMALRTNGTLWAWGAGGGGGGGSGSGPAQVGTNSQWQTVITGNGHTLALRSDRTLWAWGDNRFGQLGDGTPVLRTSPVQVGTNLDWQTVAAGGQHTMGLRSGGTLWAWGDNGLGKLGVGTTGGYYPEPVPVGTNANWKAVAAGDYHTMGLRSDGTLWAWGYNSSGQFGDGSGVLFTPSPVPVGTNADWQAVAAVGSRTMALRSNGTLWAWGDNSYGELGDGTTVNRISPVQIGTNADWQAVAAGGSHTLALRADGTLWAWGNHGNGQLGIGVVQVQVLGGAVWGAPRP